jgi:TRAP-type C4-dicarboxylate transport system permease small subunit
MWLARIACFALAVIAVVTFCDVILRYVFNRPLTFTVELTQMCMAVIVFFGVGLVTHENAHVSVDFVTLRLSVRVQAFLGVLTNLLALGYLVLLVWRIWARAEVAYSSGDVTPILAFPLWPVAVLIAAGSILLLTGVFYQLLVSFQRARNPAAAPAAAPAQPFRE